MKSYDSTAKSLNKMLEKNCLKQGILLKGGCNYGESDRKKIMPLVFAYRVVRDLLLQRTDYYEELQNELKEISFNSIRS